MLNHILPENKPEPACKTAGCEMCGIALSKCGGLYVSFGKTAAGTLRYRCQLCKKTFTGKATPTRGQRRSEKNRDVFTLIMNKVPISRIVEITGLSPKAIYDKINLIHKKCGAFAGDREARLLSADFAVPTIYLATDRQYYMVNWSERSNRRTVQLNAIASADIKSSYVFGLQLNFDEKMDPEAVNKAVPLIGDDQLMPPFRKYARLWLEIDRAMGRVDSLTREFHRKSLAGLMADDPLNQAIYMEYEDASIRLDVETTDDKGLDKALPKRGMQVHDTYTIYAHFMMLSRLLRNAPKVRIYMDQDSGFRAGFMAAFHSRIKLRTADAYYVKVNKDANAYEKQNAVANALAELAKVAAHTGVSEEEAALVMMKLEIKKAAALGKWKDRWAKHPRPIASEPEKKVCWLTDLNDYDEDHAARLMLKATLHPVDRFFMQIRRRISLAERPIASARDQQLKWYGYSAYNPAVLAKYLEIYRTYFNYCLAGEDEKSPAMHLGLAKALIDPQEILYFEG